MDIFDFLIQEAIIIVPALWIIGTFLKSTPNVPDWLIPWCLLGLGVFGSVSLLGTTPENVVQGILVAGAAVLGHQLKIQTERKDSY